MRNPMAQALAAYPQGGWVSADTRSYASPEQASMGDSFMSSGGSELMGALGSTLGDKFRKPTGKDIDKAAQYYGPEVAKMGGSVSAPGGPTSLASILRMFGG